MNGIAREVREGQQIPRADAARRRLGAVVLLLHPHQHRRVVPGRAEPAAALRVPEQVVLRALQRQRPVEPCRIAIGLKQLEQAEDQKRVVLGVRLDRGIALAIPAQQHTALRRSTSCLARTAPPAGPTRDGAGPDPLPSPGRERPPPASTRAARANAAIIKPFQPVSTLSSRCGRGRVARASNNVTRARVSASATSSGVATELAARCRRSPAPCRAGSCR